MQVKSLRISNFRSLSEVYLNELGRINVVIGENNSGKSSILKALHLMQQGGSELGPNVRIGSRNATVLVELVDVPRLPLWKTNGTGTAHVSINIATEDRVSAELTMSRTELNGGQQTQPISQLPNREPDHFIVPYLSRRKTTQYQEDVSIDNALQVGSDMSLLAAKLSRVATPGFPEFEVYNKSCKDILGFVVTPIGSTNGQRPGTYLPTRQPLPIDLMGDGVPNIASLLADLALSKGKLFLVEEPENDLHPTALKALLDLILQSSADNQFFVSTHSNIVVRHLAANEDSKLFALSADKSLIPTIATVAEVERAPRARLAALRELGYSLSDFDLWDGWLILEESSAERIIRDYLIPWFAPKLARVRPIATGGNGQVEPTFTDFNRMIRFTHLEEAYRNAAWVRIDGDEEGKRIIERLQKGYSSWSPDRFKCYEKTQFEEYYPTFFKDRIAAALGESNGNAKREAKRKLLDDVRTWLDEDAARGKTALRDSAAEIIADLESISNQLP